MFNLKSIPPANCLVEKRKDYNISIEFENSKYQLLHWNVLTKIYCSSHVFFWWNNNH